MKRTTLTIAALVVATITAGAAVPALAQDAGDNRGPEMQLRGPGGEHGMFFANRGRGDGDGMQMRMRGGPGGILALVCSENGADRLEHMLLNFEQRTDPTAEQRPLYDAFKSAALGAQADFAAACPDTDAAATTDLVDRMKAGLDIQQAHLDAMTAVLPSFEAFYDSLSDEQKAALEPRRQVMKQGMLDDHRPGEMRGPGFERRN